MKTGARGQNTKAANRSLTRPPDLTALLQAVAVELTDLAATTQTIQHALGRFLETGSLPGTTETTGLQELDRLHQIQADLGNLLDTLATHVTHAAALPEAELRNSLHLRELHERLGLSALSGSASQAKGDFDLF